MKLDAKKVMERKKNRNQKVRFLGKGNKKGKKKVFLIKKTLLKKGPPRKPMVWTSHLA